MHRFSFRSIKIIDLHGRVHIFGPLEAVVILGEGIYVYPSHHPLVLAESSRLLLDKEALSELEGLSLPQLREGVRTILQRYNPLGRKVFSLEERCEYCGSYPAFSFTCHSCEKFCFLCLKCYTNMYCPERRRE